MNCEVKPEPGAHCFERATRFMREPYTPAAFKVACCPEHAESLKRFGYSPAELVPIEQIKTNSESELACCDDCGEPSDQLTDHDDSDRSVGHYSMLWLCPDCLKRRLS